VSRASGAAAGAAAAAFAALAVLVAAGKVARLDQWAVEHAMPGAAFGGKPTFADAIVTFLGAQWHGGWHIVSTVVTAPASFTPALLITTVACLELRGRAAAALAAGFVAGNVIEVVVKETLTRPPLYADGAHITGFDASFPSGHTIRTVLVVLSVAWAWPRLTWWAVAWAPASIALLLLGGQHVPSDIAGGLLVAAMIVSTAWSWRFGAARTNRRPSPADRPSARET
jgi:membrane-associated phospholipid phosphatase